MANFIIWERRMQMKPDSCCFPRAESDGGAEAASSEALPPACSDRPWRGQSADAAELREQMAGRGGDAEARLAGEAGERWRVSRLGS